MTETKDAPPVIVVRGVVPPKCPSCNAVPKDKMYKDPLGFIWYEHVCSCGLTFGSMNDD